jgi:hypothetical protein
MEIMVPHKYVQTPIPLGRDLTSWSSTAHSGGRPGPSTCPIPRITNWHG